MQLTATAPVQGWLRSPGFDSVFIFGLLALGLLAGAVVLAEPRLFHTVLLLDLWLLGYHHVIATYTRLVFDTESFQQHKALVLYLPLGVLLLAGLIGVSLGIQALTTIYLYWQWYHYTRQSEGIAKAYARKSGHNTSKPDLITRLTFWIVPLDGIVNVSFRAPGTFLGFPVYTLPVPIECVFIMDCAAVLCLALWSFQQIKALVNGNLSIPYILYMFSHFVIYYISYVLMPFINYGWLIINVWHNSQYIAFVWMFNNNRFKKVNYNNHKFMSTISQSNKIIIYLLICITMSTSIYYSIGILMKYISFGTITVTLVVYQTINFHHYIVDSIIWKLRKKPIQINLGII